MPEFSYDAAFERNLGLLTEAEQLALRGKRVAIAGMGGVGGVHLITLVRLGIGAFHIADFDRFSLVNFNRQFGANINTIDRPKAQVMEELALAINPTLRIRRFDEGVTPENLETFLSGVDLFVDGFDFFVMDIRRRVHARCRALGIPAIVAGPIGMSTGFVAFSPGGMSFEQYFGMEGRPEDEQYLRFYVGLAPKMRQGLHLVDKPRFNVANKSGPSSGAACELCAGVAAITAVKFLLHRGDPMPAPWTQQYDALQGKLKQTKLRWGLNGPLLRLKLKLFGPGIIARMRAQPAPPATFLPKDPIDEILHAARWAPSADNEQPWRFEKLGSEAILIHLRPYDGENVYHYRAGELNLLTAGMLLENLRVAASAHSRRMEWRIDAGPDPLRLHVAFTVDDSVEPDQLYAAVGLRSVDRNRYRTRKLTDGERAALEGALDGRLKIEWHTTTAARWRFARLAALATSIRLRAPETLQIHQRIIDWTANLSATKIPAGALGLDRITLGMMRWGLKTWGRMQLLNRLGGTFGAAVEMDYIPIVSSAATFAVRFPLAAEGVRQTDEILDAGTRIQRFWLAATRLGLALQPVMAILVFADYGQRGLPFTANQAVRAKAQRLAEQFHEIFKATPANFVFMGRIGEPLPRTGACRSVRQPVSELVIPPS